MTYQEILYQVEDGVATVTLNRPEKLNAITNLLYDEMRAALLAADADDAVRVMVLTGAGRGFCAGPDMARLDGIAKAGALPARAGGIPFDAALRGDYQDRYTFFAALKKPVIAALNGAAAGVGLLLALFCDIRIAADDAVLTTGFARRGLVAELGMGWRLVQLVGQGRATDLLLRAPKVSGREAAAMGLVEFSAPRAEFADFCRQYTRELATEVSPRSMRVMKRQLWDLPFQTLGEHLRDARLESMESWKSEDFREGLAYFHEKRPPRFTGR